MTMLWPNSMVEKSKRSPVFQRTTRTWTLATGSDSAVPGSALGIAKAANYSALINSFESVIRAS